MANEFYRNEAPGDVAIRLTPAGQGRLEVYLDGENIFDRKEDSGGFPNLTKVNELKMVIAEKLFEFEAALTSD